MATMKDLLKRLDQTTIFVQPILFVLVTTINALNIGILRSPALRSSPCTYYFLAYSIFSIVNICCLCPTQILRRFSILWIHSSIGCKMQDFLFFSLAIQMKSMLTLASFDRFCSSAKLVRWRSFSRIPTAKRTIVFVSVLSVVAMSPMLVTQHYNAQSNRCEQNETRWNVVYTVGQVCLYYVVIPTLMILFGTLTIVNIRRRSSFASNVSMKHRVRPNEKQLARMLLCQVAAHLICTIPFGISHLMRLFAVSIDGTVLAVLTQASISWLQCDYFMFFFLYILSAGTYRRELHRLLTSSPCPRRRDRRLKSNGRISANFLMDEILRTSV